MSVLITDWGWSEWDVDYGGSVWGPGGLRADLTGSGFVHDGHYLTVDFTKKLDALHPGDHWMFTAPVHYMPAEFIKYWGEVIVNHYPTPEPATLALVAVGGLALLRRRAR